MPSQSATSPLALPSGERFRRQLDAALFTALETEDTQLTRPDRPAAPDALAFPLADHGRLQIKDEAIEARLKVSRMRNFSPATAILRQHRSRQGSLEETLLEIYFANLSICRAEATAQALWGDRLDVAAISAFSQKIVHRIDAWLHRPIRGTYPYVYLESAPLRTQRRREASCPWLMLAVGVNAEGGREVLGLSAAPDGSEGSWPAFLQQLKDRGLSQVDLCVGGFDPDLRKAVAAIFPAAAYQGCILQLQRDVLSLVPAAQAYLAIELLQSIHLGDSRKSAVTRLVQAVAQLQAIQLPEAAALLGQIGEQTLSYYAYPENHWRRLNNLKPLHKVLRESRERARVLGSASDGAAAVLLVSARLRHIARTTWGRRRYLDMTSRKAGAFSLPS